MAFVPLQFQKYPGIERQDLTQGQLKSFKFTPVDNASYHSRNSTRDWLKSTAQLQMQHQLQDSVHRAIAVQHQKQDTKYYSENLPYPNLWQNSPSNRQRASTLPPPAISLFTGHNKTHLADSRLKFGPAALRSAVESHSPEKGREPGRSVFIVSARPVLHFTSGTSSDLFY